MSIAYRPPFDEDDELDLRAVYRKPRTGGSPELDAAVRRTWHPGHSWHPGWAAAACAALVAGLFAWTDMRENAEMIDMTPQLAVSQEAEASPERAPAPRLVGTDAPAPQQAAAPEIQRAAQPPAESQANVPPQLATAEPAPQAAALEPAAEQTASAEPVAFSDQDIEARVAHIRALMQDDQQEDAVAALRELQQGAPDLTLPDDLQELAQQNPAS
ncbi:hypothetical protein U2261_09915 [Achromobacter xylosoxidans]|jgi:hypothetical protein|uniref:Uncharacterized protein n=2 Tax=Alcaligenes xylosoxydans xylosoxydans TaxID=85698 RepID=A0A0D6I4E1_ALCXX|nr:hypothetical protein [Achromobacter xylosoxidans]AHC48388.1 hypothetical protein AX27061_3929 [Achromobacter xylosoxidans NBRC 15126 = ATCC 27061]AXA78610.1 hypothetical protein CE206_20215 [Achromobacter xylosoxidans]KMJ91994.1 hypothetical protein ACH58_04690 [Achromobacter xylosoxidans]KOQ19040.1 hypothetical protein ABW34_26760 [Achromobacter xylosoxidans]KOQ22105.1 hypothetical protein ABW36_25785 [Achromobacter xylosoxidans]